MPFNFTDLSEAAFKAEHDHNILQINFEYLLVSKNVFFLFHARANNELSIFILSFREK